MGCSGNSTRIHSKPGHRIIRYFAVAIAAILFGWAGVAKSQERQLEWQRVTDPNERAFTVEVPIGCEAGAISQPDKCPPATGPRKRHGRRARHQPPRSL